MACMLSVNGNREHFWNAFNQKYSKILETFIIPLNELDRILGSVVFGFLFFVFCYWYIFEVFTFENGHVRFRNGPGISGLLNMEVMLFIFLLTDSCIDWSLEMREDVNKNLWVAFRIWMGMIGTSVTSDRRSERTGVVLVYFVIGFFFPLSL